MSLNTYYIRIKKQYAYAIIKDLQKLDAIELLSDSPIPDWQKKEVRKRLKTLKKDPSKGVSLKEANKRIKRLAK